MYYHAHAFVDGAYPRRLARDLGRPLVDPQKLMVAVSRHGVIQGWAAHVIGYTPAQNHGIIFDRHIGISNRRRTQ
jgi:hypothetical protein